MLGEDELIWQLPVEGRVAILGGGLMGHAITAIFIGHGYDVTCCEPNEETRATLPVRVNEVIATMNQPNDRRGQLTMVSEPSQLSPHTS